MSSIISVNIETKRGDWPSERELEQRNKVVDELDWREVGVFIGAGAGPGGMDFEYEVPAKYEAGAVAVIKKTVDKYCRNKLFSIEATRYNVENNNELAAKSKHEPHVQARCDLDGNDKGEGYTKEVAASLQGRAYASHCVLGPCVGKVVGVVEYRYENEDTVRYGLETEFKLGDSSTARKDFMYQRSFEHSSNSKLVTGSIAKEITAAMQPGETASKDLVTKATAELAIGKQTKLKPWVKQQLGNGQGMGM